MEPVNIKNKSSAALFPSKASLDAILDDSRDVIAVLGTVYDLSSAIQYNEFVAHYKSRILFTYRRRFEPIYISQSDMLEIRDEEGQATREKKGEIIDENIEETEGGQIAGGEVNKELGGSNVQIFKGQSVQHLLLAGDVGVDELSGVNENDVNSAENASLKEKNGVDGNEYNNVKKADDIIEVTAGKEEEGKKREPFIHCAETATTMTYISSQLPNFASLQSKIQKYLADTYQVIKALLRRKGWSYFNTGYLTSDKGWGCMIRVAQMALAQVLSHVILGRKWRWAISSELQSVSHQCFADLCNILELFMDKSDAPFSIHKIVNEGAAINVAVGDWFGPTSSAIVMGKLMEKALKFHNQMPIPFIFPDGVICRSTVIQRLQRGEDTFKKRGGLLWLCMRVGVQKVNLSQYKNVLLSCFLMSNFQGIASGNPRGSAHFFIGADRNFLYYLDPHYSCHDAFVDINNVSLTEFSIPKIGQLKWETLNPSMALLFSFQDEAEFDELCSALLRFGPEVFEVVEEQIQFRSDLFCDTEVNNMLDDF